MAKVLIIGSGGREQALHYSIAKSREVSMLKYASAKDSFSNLAEIVEQLGITHVVVGPEDPLVKGIVDHFAKRGFNNVFGPTADAAQIESDKFFSDTIMKEAGIPHAESIQCYDYDQAWYAIGSLGTDRGVVIKARGLTGGKGVLVCDNIEEARELLSSHINRYGPENLISQRLFGQELSVFGIPDGEKVVALEISVQDHKRLLDGDKGPNTGGMGAYCPAPIADAKAVREIAENCMTAAVKQMKKQGIEYKGFLYAGIMMHEGKPHVLEYNCRFGDPEAQVAMMMLNGSIFDSIDASLNGREIKFDIKQGAACCVVMASSGYPEKAKTGYLLRGIDNAEDLFGVKVFHAATDIDDSGRLIATGGRVLGVTTYSALGIKEAQANAYQAVGFIARDTERLNGYQPMIFRRDIAEKAFAGK